MRPAKTFLFLFAAACLIVALTIIFPGIVKYNLSDRIALVLRGDFPELNSPVLCDTLSAREESRTDTIIPSPDTLPSPDSTSSADTTSIPLALFRSRLNTADSSVRVMVFGDSQLEGDRLSSYLRKHLQAAYGGSGPGLLQPLMPVMYTRTLEIRSSQNWKRYNYLSYRDGSLPHRELGPFMAVSRFLPPDSVSPVRSVASVRITPSVFSDSLASKYERVSIIYGNLWGECTVTLSSPGGIIASDTLSEGKGPLEYSLSIEGVADLRISFSGYSSPDIFGLSIGSERGIVVDNIPHRGSAGLEFTMVDRENLGAIFSLLRPNLVILHYGLNVVRNVREDYSYYQHGLERQFRLIRELCPDAEIVLMGLTDMADRIEGTLSSFPNIDNIRDAQQRAALNERVVFWDSFTAMGGEGSVSKWVALNPPLAQKDYTHLTYAGSDSLAKMFIRDLLTEPSVHATATATAALFMPSESVAVEPVAAVAGTEPGRIWMKGLLKLLLYDPASPFIFTNIAFWAFLLVLVAGYSLIYRNNFIRNFYLLIFSLFFYYKSGGFFLILLIVSTLTDFTAGKLIFRSRSETVRKLWLVVSLLINLGMLGYFKYYGFIIETINKFAGTSLPATDILASAANRLLGTGFNADSILLPVGISFFTFQTISYTVDVYRRKVQPVRSITDFGFYVSFFPQLVAGPIVRASEFVPQLYARFSLSKREFGHAIYLIIKGLIKKMIISDYISVNFVDRVFGAPELYTGTENLMAVYGYGLQIYCDFSGYTDIAIGVALLLGFRLPVNFNSPYKATGIADFWRRWHISLSRWLRDYLYISLGGNRRGTFRTGINLLITMTLGGLWHGASGRFVFWGLLHGFGLIINKIWNRIIPARPGRKPIFRFLQIFITFNFVSFAWIFFRAESNDLSLLMIRNIFSGFYFEHINALWLSYPLVVILIIAGYTIHFLPETIKEATRAIFVRSNLVLQFLILLCMMVILFRVQAGGIQPFIYFRF
jgi:D-alanyl-lipoteichoic acid acyltransferase DltB (MBOAT superfamily)